MPRVLITGANGGIGSSISRLFDDNGYSIFELNREQCNLENLNEVEDFVQDFDFETFDSIVMCAGINNPKTLIETDLESFQKTMNVNVLSHKLILDKILPTMMKRNFGRVVGISSLYANKSRKGRWAYSSSKLVLETLIRYIAIEFASNNILSNSVVPGFVDTPLTRKNNSDDELLELVSKIPINRLANSNEVAELVFFLASNQNTYITGQSIAVDGGISII